jgi:ATP-dependent DNA helicase RecG
MLLAADNGFQSCLMAPTEILAQQHFQSMITLLEGMNLQVELLTGNIKGKKRKQILADAAEGRLHLLVGTHALIEDEVIFKNLGLAIVDEQHRFGVQQRAKMWKKNTLPPHILVMTATPIPRTLAMTIYGDLDVSVIDQLPPGRKPIRTVHRSENHRGQMMSFIKSEIDKGRQAYIVYPLIQESEKLDYENLQNGYETVKTYFPEPEYYISMVHGKQTPEIRETNMQRFISGDCQIMVATTVIEVGVNVPNATVMVIESAERFGLSQLHQLRGRVGRGADKSYCILMTGNKMSNESRQRIRVMEQTNSGFEISEKDLELRGPGDIEGTRQSGALNFHLADLVQDRAILEASRVAAEQILDKDPDLELPEHQCLRNFLLSQTDKNQWSKIS